MSTSIDHRPVIGRNTAVCVRVRVRFSLFCYGVCNLCRTHNDGHAKSFVTVIRVTTRSYVMCALTSTCLLAIVVAYMRTSIARQKHLSWCSGRCVPKSFVLPRPFVVADIIDTCGTHLLCVCLFYENRPCCVFVFPPPPLPPVFGKVKLTVNDGYFVLYVSRAARSQTIFLSSDTTPRLLVDTILLLSDYICNCSFCYHSIIPLLPCLHS